MRDKPRFIQVSAIWYERFLECSRTQGTPIFPSSVWRFYHSLLDLGKKELAIQSIVADYYFKEWLPELRNKVNERMEKEISDSAGILKGIEIEEEANTIVNLFDFIKQTIQDSGIGWQIGDDGGGGAWDYADAIE